MSLISKLFAVANKVPAIQKNSINPHFGNTYVSLDRVLETVLPVLAEDNLMLMQWPTNVSGVPALRTVIYDIETEESMEDTMMLVLERDNPQGQGSALTYAKRYAILSIFGLTADEDDDGQKASTGPTKARPIKTVNTSDEPSYQF